VIFLILISLLGWLLFINGQKDELSQTAAGRGFGVNIPTFDSRAVGSTNQNIKDVLLSGFGLSPNNGSEREDNDSSQLPRLWNPSPVPAAGIEIMGTGSTTKIQFVERPSGNVFESFLLKGEIRRISNTLIPKVYRAFWGGEKTLVMQHLDENNEVATLLGTVQPAATNTETSTERGVDGVFEASYLEPDVLSVSTTRDNDGIFYLVRTVNGAIGIRTNLEKTEAKRVFSSRVYGWQARGINSKTTLLYQNPSQGVNGSAFLIDEDGNKTIVKSNIRGLIVTISRDLNNILYNSIVEGRISLFSETIGEEEKMLTLTTFAEKCVFNPQNSFIAYCAVPREIPDTTLPDSWYRGEVHFSDDWWIIDIQNGSVEQLISPESDYGIPIDVLDPKINSEGTHIVFLDARTRTPWVLRIVQ